MLRYSKFDRETEKASLAHIAMIIVGSNKLMNDRNPLADIFY